MLWVVVPRSNSGIQCLRRLGHNLLGHIIRNAHRRASHSRSRHTKRTSRLPESWAEDEQEIGPCCQRRRSCISSGNFCCKLPSACVALTALTAAKVLLLSNCSACNWEQHE